MRYRGKFQPLHLHEDGLTLIELLVSMVILGFIVTIMSGAFFQVSQIVRIAETVNGQFQPQWLRANSLVDLVANLALPEGVERPFKGDSSGFEGFSLSLPQGDWGTVQAFKASLKSQQGGVDLIVAGTDDKPVVLASWDGPMEFEYLTVDGASESMWPPFGRNADAVPSGIIVRSNSGERRVQLIAPYAGSRKVERDAKRDMGKLLGVDVP